MKYFITGATGFVGSWVAQFLTEKGADVTCLVRKTSNLRWLESLPVSFHSGSLEDIESLKAGVQDSDFVLHIAGVTKALSTEEYYHGNVTATRNLLQAVREVNSSIRQFVHISSVAACGPSPSADLAGESLPCRPITEYGRSKLHSEEVVSKFQSDLPVVILRPPAVYGPRDGDVFEVFKNIYHRINLMVGWHDQLVSLIHVWDLAKAIILAAESPRATGETFFVCDDHPYFWSEVTHLMEKVMDRKALTVRLPFFLGEFAAGCVETIARLRGKATILNRDKIREVRQPFWTFSNRKIKENLNFQQTVSLEEGIKNTFAWYREQGWL